MNFTVTSTEIIQYGYLAFLMAAAALVAKNASSLNALYGLFEKISRRKLEKINEYLSENNSGINSNEMSELLKNQRDELYFKSVFGCEGGLEYRKALIELHRRLCPDVSLYLITYCRKYTEVVDGRIVVVFSSASKFDVAMNSIMSALLIFIRTPTPRMRNEAPPLAIDHWFIP